MDMLAGFVVLGIAVYSLMTIFDYIETQREKKRITEEILRMLERHEGKVTVIREKIEED